MDYDWVKPVLVVALLGAGGYASYQKGATDERQAWELKALQTREKDLDARLELAQKIQENGAKRDQANQKTAAALAATADSLRNRPERPANLSEAPRDTCQGANGAELARGHAEFLAGVAARAKRQDNALQECYGALDEAKGVFDKLQATK